MEYHLLSEVTDLKAEMKDLQDKVDRIEKHFEEEITRLESAYQKHLNTFHTREVF